MLGRLPRIRKTGDTSTTTGTREIKTVASRTWPGLPKHALISNFAGIRAHTKNHDFILGEPEDAPGFFNAAGIESPGLTAAPAIAQFLADEISRKLQAERNTEFNPMRKPIRSFRAMSIEKKADAIAKNPLYGRIVCRCEQVTEAEVRAAIRRPVGARTVDAVKRRTRSGMGRCQGGFCLPRVVDILSQELGQSPASITKDGEQSKILLYDRSDQPDLRQPDLPWNRASLEPSLLIIGAGPAGLAAAIAAYDSGCRDILIIEREPEPGGILRQCIHTGLACKSLVTNFPPEYAQRYIDQVNEAAFRFNAIRWCSRSTASGRPVSAQRRACSSSIRRQSSWPWAVANAEGSLGIGTRGAGIFSGNRTALRQPGRLHPRKVDLGSGDIGRSWRGA